MLLAYTRSWQPRVALLALAIPAVAQAQSNPGYPPGYGTPYSQQPTGQPAYPVAAPGQPYPNAPGGQQQAMPQQQRMPAQGYPQWNPQQPGQPGASPQAPYDGMNMGPGPNAAAQAPYGYPAGMQPPPGASQFGGAPQSEWAPSQAGPAQTGAGAPYGMPAYEGQQAGASPYGQPPLQQDPYAAGQQPGFGQQPYAGQQPGYPPQNAAPQRVNPYNIPPQQGQAIDPGQDPQYRMAATPTPTDPAARAAQPNPSPQPSHEVQPGEHPLMPALRWAREGLPYVQAIEDYSCIVHKRERVDGHLGDHQAMFCKVRHRPFSVYMYFLSPPNLKGQEVIYVDGKNNGNLQAHSTGVKGIVGTVSLDPRGHLAMRGNRYPVTELGVQNLITRLIEVGEHDANYGECDVQFLKAKISNRPCTCIQVHHPERRRNFRFHVARIYVDDELNIPIRFESWDWPARPGGEPLLLEEYTYQNLKLNNGFTELDFDVSNPKYGFR